MQLKNFLPLRERVFDVSVRAGLSVSSWRSSSAWVGGILHSLHGKTYQFVASV